jgi:hypothetical protein
MKKITMFAFAILTFTLPQLAFACDKQVAGEVQTMMREMGTWYEKNGSITFEWGADWDLATSSQRSGLIRTFADSDACLTGNPRSIKYYRKGKLVGEASPTTGINVY